MENINIYENFYSLLDDDKPLVTNNEFFLLLEQYSKQRIHDLGLDGLKLNLYYQKREYETINGQLISGVVRFNPITNKVATDFKGLIRAFCSSDSINIDIEYDEKPIKHKIWNLMDYIMTLEHELRHAIQHKSLESGEESFLSFNSAKDQTIMSEFGHDFYLYRHDGFFIEKDAIESGYNYMKSLLEKRNLINEDTLKILNNYVDRRDFPGIRDFIIDIEYGPDNIKYKKKINIEAEKLMNLLFKSIIKNNPKYLKYFPILRKKYNDDGTTKSYREMKEELEKRPNLKELYEGIINDDPILLIQKIEDDLINDYINAKNYEDQSKILDDGINKIKSIINKEELDLDNILIYLNKRMNDINKSNNENKSTSKLVFLTIKQTLLDKKVYKAAYVNTESFKEDIRDSMNILKDVFGISFNESYGRIRRNIDNIKLAFKDDGISKFNYKRIFSEDEKKKYSELIDKCEKFISNKSYIIVDENTKTKEKVDSLFEGFDNLYQSKYYKEYIKNETDLEERVNEEKNFELANQLYIEMQSHLGLTGNNINESFIVFIGKSPIIEKILNEKPEVLSTLKNVYSMEDDNENQARLNIVISYCENMINDNKKANLK